MARTKYQTIDEYITDFPNDIQKVLEKLRQIIGASAPEAEEIISYNIPAYRYHGFLIYFSAYKEHYSISMPPTTEVFSTFKKELAEYKQSKSTIQFPYAKLMPKKLLADITKLRVKENSSSSK